jgi:hypothetical protein
MCDSAGIQPHKEIYYKTHVSVQVLTVLNSHIVAIWVMEVCTPTGQNQCFRKRHCVHFHGRQYTPPKHWYPTRGLYSVIIQKMIICMYQNLYFTHVFCM